MMHDKHLEEMKRSGVVLGDQAPPAVAAKAKAKAAAVTGRRAAALPGIDDGQITIPGLQVLPTVELDDAGAGAAAAPVAPVYSSARQQSLDDVITK